jgi:hypothetical protein
MKNHRRIRWIVALFTFGLSIPAATLQPAVSAINPPPSPVATPAIAPAAPAKIPPDLRRQLFFQLLQDTFKETGIRPDGLIMIGTGSWMSTNPDKRAGSRDIDATIAYINDTLDHDQSWAFKQKFDELKEKLRPIYGEVDITLFSDVRSGQANEPDYYHGPVGQYFLRLHSDDNNKNSSFTVTPGADPQPQLTDFFWTARDQDPPNSIAGAYVFVTDNMDFLHAHLPNQTPVEQAKLIGKYVQRVEVTLKQAIWEKWRINLPSTNERVTNITACLGNIKNSNGDFELLEGVPDDQIEADVRKCLGIGPGDDLKFAVGSLLAGANGYFNSTTLQVKNAEPIDILSPEPTPSPTNTSSAPSPTNTSSTPSPENTSSAPSPENTTSAPSPENTTSAPSPENTTSAPSPENTSSAS